MRLTDDRYATERAQFELALRMIGHEARTRTIRECTGLSDDRIRKLYGTYFQHGAAGNIKRHRGKSPRQIGRFVKSAQNQLESTTLIALYCCNQLLRIDTERNLHALWPRPSVDYGRRLCDAYEVYMALHAGALLSFEWAWSLLQTVSLNDELYLSSCRECNTFYVQDSYALDLQLCPCCEISNPRRRKLSVSNFSR